MVDRPPGKLPEGQPHLESRLREIEIDKKTDSRTGGLIRRQ